MDALQWRKMLKEKIKQITNTKQFHMCMVLVIIVAIIFVAGVISLRYNVEGEGTPPFTISKVSIISSVDGTDVEGSEEKWNLKVNGNNDIYLYIKKIDLEQSKPIFSYLNNFLFKFRFVIM